MENCVQYFNNPKFGQIRTVYVNGQIHFVASDIAKSLGYSNTCDAIQRHCRWVAKHDIPHPQNKNKTIEVNVIPEGDIYRLVVHSELPTAQKFEHWVFDEVLPSIRKTGSYSTHQQPLSACLEDLIIQQATLLKELRLKVEAQEKRINDMIHIPFSHCQEFFTAGGWLKTKNIPFQRNFLWLFSRKCAKYSRENKIEIREVGKGGYVINAYREDVLERCFGNIPVPTSIPAPKKKKVELTDCLKSWFAKIPAPERLAMLENFAMWGSQVPEKFRMAVLHTLTASIGKTVFEYEETKKIRRIG